VIVVASRSSMAAVVAQSKSPASSRLSHGGSLARRGFLLISTLQLTAVASSCLSMPPAHN